MFKNIISSSARHNVHRSLNSIIYENDIALTLIKNLFFSFLEKDVFMLENISSICSSNKDTVYCSLKDVDPISVS
jgi:hypothetical protein